LASESNSASASTKRSGASRAAASPNPGKARGSTQGSLPRWLCQQDLLFSIDHDQPLQIVPKALFSAILLLATAEKVRADRVWRYSCAIDGTGNAHLGLAAAQAAHRFSQPARDRVLVEPLQKAIQRRVVGPRAQMQSFSPVARLGQTAFRLAKSPVLVTHQAENASNCGWVH